MPGRCVVALSRTSLWNWFDINLQRKRSLSVSAVIRWFWVVGRIDCCLGQESLITRICRTQASPGNSRVERQGWGMRDERQSGSHGRTRIGSTIF